MPSRLGRVRIYDPGSTTTVDLTLTVADLAEFPTVGSPAAFPLDGRTESRPWSVDVVDVGSTFSANLSDSTGRMDILGRLADFQINNDGAGWNTKGTGRISDVFLNQNVASYRVFVDDERMLERRQRIFTTSTTTQVYPPGLTIPWLGFPVVSRTEASIAAIDNLVTLVAFRREGAKIGNFPQSVIRAILEDIKDNPIEDKNATSGNFTDLRLNVAGTDYEVVSFDNLDRDNFTFEPTFVQTFANENADTNAVAVWVASTAIGAEDDQLQDAYLHMGSTHPPSVGLPLHIFSSSGDARVGIHPFKLLRRIYNGDYGGNAIRISSSAFDDIENEYGHLGNTFFRITEPPLMSEWVEENIYQTYGALPFIDQSGRVAPRSWFPPSTSVIDTTALQDFTGTNSVVHPTWEHNRADMVNVVRFEYPEWHVGHLNPNVKTNTQQNAAEGGDNLQARTQTVEIVYDNTTSMGRFEHKIKMFGAPVRTYPWARNGAEFISQEIFDRFGDGPIRGEVTGLSTADSVNPGDYVSITLPSYPNADSTTGRGSARYVQVMERIDRPGELGFTYLDMGPNANAIAAPTFSVARSTVSAKHACNITISSMATTDSKWQMRYALTATSESAPSSDSDLWDLARFGDHGSTQTVTLSPLPSGQGVHIQMRGIGRQRIRSAWSSAESTTLESLEASTFVGQVSTYASKIVPDCTGGSTIYPLEMHLDHTTTADFTSTNRIITIPAGNSPVGASSGHGLAFENLSTASQPSLKEYLFGVRHVDAYGGVGAFESTGVTVSTSASIETLPDMRGINILWGNDIQ